MMRIKICVNLCNLRHLRAKIEYDTLTHHVIKAFFAKNLTIHPCTVKFFQVFGLIHPCTAIFF